MKKSKYHHWTQFFDIDPNEICDNDLSDILRNHFSIDYRDKSIRQIETEFRESTIYLLKTDFACPGQYKPLQVIKMMKVFDSLKDRISEVRDRELVEDTILEIMENRGVNREEAERIFNNPF